MVEHFMVSTWAWVQFPETEDGFATQSTGTSLLSACAVLNKNDSLTGVLIIRCGTIVKGQEVWPCWRRHVSGAEL